MQTLDGFLYLNAKAVKFFRRNILSARVLNNILKLIYQIIKTNYNNLITFFNLSAKNFVTTFRFLGSTYYNFIVSVFYLAFDGVYFFTNYIFVYDIIKYTHSCCEDVCLSAEELNNCFDYVNDDLLYKYEDFLGFNNFLDFQVDTLEHVS